jgi:hypothetical protein
MSISLRTARGFIDDRLLASLIDKQESHHHKKKNEAKDSLSAIRKLYLRGDVLENPKCRELPEQISDSAYKGHDREDRYDHDYRLLGEPQSPKPIPPAWRVLWTGIAHAASAKNPRSIDLETASAMSPSPDLMRLTMDGDLAGSTISLTTDQVPRSISAI